MEVFQGQGVVPVRPAVAGADVKRAAAGHGLNRVERQIVEHLHDLPLVGFHGGKVGGKLEIDLHVGALDDIADRLLDDRRQRQRLPHGVAAAREGQ